MSNPFRRDRGPVADDHGSSFSDAAVARSPRPGTITRVQSAYNARVHGFDADDPLGSFADPGVEGERRSRGGRILRRLASLVVFALALGLLVGLGAIAWFALDRSDVEPGQDVSVTIPADADAGQIADILAEANVVDSPTIFRARLRLNDDGAGLRAGTYAMKTGWSYDSIIETLEKGPPPAPTFDVLIPEGFRVTEMARAIDQQRAESMRVGGDPLPAFTGQEYLAAVKARQVPAQYEPPEGTASLEGFLFPATYELRTVADAETLVDKQLEAFAANFAEIDMTRAREANLTPYDVVTIASLIEREAVLEEERDVIAAVIWNRLKVGEVLGIDATIQYAVDPVEWVTELRQSDLAIDSPYNSRTNAGLPPTPIASPGLASLKAAANPADVDYRYYVANPDGSGEHFFTESYDEFLAHEFQQG